MFKHHCQSIDNLTGGGNLNLLIQQKGKFMKKILVFMMVALMLFVSCNSSTPAPDEKPGTNPPPTISEGSLVEKTTTGKFVVESTINSLSAKIQEALESGRTVDLKGETLSNGVTVTTGTISVSSSESSPAARSARAIGDNYQIVINITEATDEENKSVTLEYTSNVTVDETTKTITSIEPVSTVATIDNTEVSDIDSETFIPVALAFSDVNLLSKLGIIMETVAEQLSNDLGITMEKMTLNVAEIGSVVVDCEKSALTPTGKGVLVFRLEELDNQWHTMSNLGGQITIDGWADVTEEGIVESDNLLIKDEEHKTHDDIFVSGEFAPRFYGLYYSTINTIMFSGDSFEAGKKDLETISAYASEIYGENISVTSYSMKAENDFNNLYVDLSYENPGILTVNATLSEYGDVEMVVHAYSRENDIMDYQIVKMLIDGEDYSYLSLDMLKSMYRVFAAFTYSNSIASQVMGSINPTTSQGSTYPLTLTNNYSGTVTVHIDELNMTAQKIATSFNYENVKVQDDVEYVISGSGSFSFDAMTQTSVSNVTSFNIKGIGNCTATELETANSFLKIIINSSAPGGEEPTLEEIFSGLADLGTERINIPGNFYGTYSGYFYEEMTFDISNTGILITYADGTSKEISDNMVTIQRQGLIVDNGIEGYALAFSSSEGDFVITISLTPEYNSITIFSNENGKISTMASIPLTSEQSNY